MQANLTGLTVEAALGVAMLRKVQRLAAIREELEEVGAACCITPTDLLLLEDNGFLLDFDSFTCIDTLSAVDAERVAS